MNAPRVEGAVVALRELLRREPGITAAVLFGSAARGTASEESDIDVLVVTERDPHPFLRRIRDLERQHDVQISPLILKPGDVVDLDRQFLDSLLRDGLQIRGELPAVTVAQLQLRPFRLVSLFVTHLEPRAKVRLSRLLDGYSTVKRRGRKQYVHRFTGLLKRVGGWRIGRGAVVIPDPAVAELEAILEGVGAKRSLVPIWVQRP